MAEQKCKECTDEEKAAGEEICKCTEEEQMADYERLRHIYDEKIHYEMNTRWNFTLLLQERIRSGKHFHCSYIWFKGTLLANFEFAIYGSWAKQRWLGYP